MTRSIFQNLARFLRPNPEKPSSDLDYWTQRAATYGSRAVLNLAHPAEDYDAVTRRQKDEIFPLLSIALDGSERNILDFGCGPGRFTEDLARLISGRAIGIDPIARFIEEARTRASLPTVQFHVSKELGIAMKDESVDVVWVCLVLGGLHDRLLEGAVREIQRVLRPGGLLFVIENTSALPGHTYWTFRNVKTYEKLFPEIGLLWKHSYDDLGETISVFSGRKQLC